MTALMLATRSGRTKKVVWEGCFRCVELLIKLGADTEVTSNSGKKAINYLHDDEMKDKFRSIVEDTWYDTELHELVHRNDITKLKAFLESKKQDIDIRGRNGWTALHTATFCDRKEAFEVLLQQGASVLPDDMGKTPLHIVSQRGDLRMMMSIFQIVSMRKSDIIESEGKTMIPWWCNPMSERDNIVFNGVE